MPREPLATIFSMILVLQDMTPNKKIKANKTNKTRLNIQFRQTLSMDAALDIKCLLGL